ncbi:DUF761 domain-containing protein/DUF4408 domain-containing protein [Cephalotus follicularis]|uniref:DUF761 domain-containing protein/DUF4408 domain-containing protein n=1 Tax=Cephalotus follicularis TaxID=3775 RepID=A0A1Q3CYS0_CEPFO|nr:DUF761 domain-containing protein/DUF4408 domain-containing protein [Cephalotus follicularis]
MVSLLSKPSGNLLLSLKIALISTGVLSAAVILKLTVPFAVSDIAPCVYSKMSSLLRPPYLYLVVNCIIISIVASSKLQQKPVKVAADVRSTEYNIINGYNGIINEASSYRGGYDDESRVIKALGDQTVEKKVVAIMHGGDAEVGVSRLVGAPQRSDSVEFVVHVDEKVEQGIAKEMPLVSSRFHHRKTVKASGEAGKALGVSRPPRRHDTLESTWKTITEGRAMPLNRHHKKAESWDTHVRNNTSSSNDQNTLSKMKKSESTNSGGRLRKEPSLSQEEVNRRVEAFINKFNEEMRLQRQESLFQEMLRRGAH